MNDEEKITLITKAASVFTPGAPVDKYALFAGRKDQVHDAINAIFQRGHHVIIFGERGVGKTSLVNVLAEVASKADLQAVKCGTINCDNSDDFSSLWHKIFREISVVIQKPQLGFTTTASSTMESNHDTVSLEKFTDKKIKPDDVRFLLDRVLDKKNNIIIIDELDRLSNRETTTLLADTIKTLSDHSSSTTLILVGVADSVNGLISEHISIERALVQIHMPRMSIEEISEILDRGLTLLAMAIDSDAKETIAKLSQGLPHYTHLLALHAAQTAIDNNRTNIIMDDVGNAIKLAVKKAQQSTLQAYHKATISTRETIYANVLLACALAKADELGYFAASDVRDPLSQIMGKRYEIPTFSRHLNAFCDMTRGPVLQKTGTTRRFRFRFVNPLMQPFVIIHGLAENLISKDTLTKIKK